jgi:prevent-host-death family protein
VKRAPAKGVEEARREFPAILDAAAQGGTTIITRRGIAVAAVVPASVAAKVRPLSLLTLDSCRQRQGALGSGVFEDDRAHAR